MLHWSEMRSVDSGSCAVSFVSYQWVWAAEPQWTQVMMTEVKLGLEQDLHLDQRAQQRQWPSVWLADWLTEQYSPSAPPLLFLLFSGQLSRQTAGEGKQPRVSKKDLKGSIRAACRAGGWGVGAQLQHQCLLMCGPIRELLDVVWTKQIVAVCVQRVRVIIGSTWGARKHTWSTKHTCKYELTETERNLQTFVRPQYVIIHTDKPSNQVSDERCAYFPQ